MGNVRGLVALAFVVACNGDKGDGGPGTETGTGPGEPLKFTFLSSVPATDYDAEVAGNALIAHQVSSMFLASAAVVAADEKVQDRLNVDGGGGYNGFSRVAGSAGGVRAASLACWSRPEFPMFSFAIDYSPCEAYDMDGGVYIDDHPSGPLLFEYQDFKIKTRKMGGVLALDTQGAYIDPSCTELPCQPYWVAYNTDIVNPGPDNPVQLGVTVDGVPYGVSYTGGASVNFGDQEWSMWGVLDVGIDSDTTVQVVHGGVVPPDVAPDDPPGADVDQSSLNWLSCRCPTSGIEAQELPLHFTHLTLDLDSLEDVPDAIDDPTLELDVDKEIPGSAVLHHTGCGTYDVDYTSDPVEITVGTDELQGAISFQCATLAIDDEARCTALLNAAKALGTTFTVTVSPEDATATAKDAVNSDFDTQWCRIQ
jgi:hypothetical protein